MPDNAPHNALRAAVARGVAENGAIVEIPAHPNPAENDRYGRRNADVSVGHICFVPRVSGGWWEYWVRAGQVWRMDASAPVMPDGFRSGRWYGPERESIVAQLHEAARAGMRTREEESS